MIKSDHLLPLIAFAFIITAWNSVTHGMNMNSTDSEWYKYNDSSKKEKYQPEAGRPPLVPNSGNSSTNSSTPKVFGKSICAL
ncbi:MAG: hypothetical protein LBH38_02090 [Holosporales bacterium]|jgi:hypothetical protein|nr:hypothetical protein [Holosporales bacterium]